MNIDYLNLLSTGLSYHDLELVYVVHKPQTINTTQ